MGTYGTLAEPVTGATLGAAGGARRLRKTTQMTIRRPWCNRKADDDIRRRRRAHGRAPSLWVHLLRLIRGYCARRRDAWLQDRVTDRQSRDHEAGHEGGRHEAGDPPHATSRRRGSAQRIGSEIKDLLKSFQVLHYSFDGGANGGDDGHARG